MLLRYFVATTLVHWALHILPSGRPGRAELAIAQMKICREASR